MIIVLQVDIDIRELRELNKNAIQKMKEVIEKHPEMAADVEEMLSRASLIFFILSSLCIYIYIYIHIYIIFSF